MPRSGGVMVVAEAAEGGLAPISAELAAVGRTLADELSQPLSAVLLGSGAAAAVEELARLGPDRVLVADDLGLADYQADAYLAVLAPLVREEGPEILLLGQTPSMRELAPRLAFRLGTGLTTDCTALRIEDGVMVMTKPVFGGSALSELSIPEARPQIATVRARVFQPAPPRQDRQAEVRHLEVKLDAVRTRVLETVREAASSGPRLKDAKVVVSGGRGLGGPENWNYVEQLAETLGAAVGATRAVTDAGWVPSAFQVGLTGVTISPDLYITVGVSGAVQHIAGCSGARNIVAINKDPDANIFKHARFGVVADYKQVVPALTQRIKELRG
ncbi:MAG TPA: electron transfer flavoprotein subunit alpha/FixB family protein [Chloroflexota bacterium]|nr:electron transfer flavoprotein subunit alpha/FixB family protein [Chloroflexota bacterium]